MQASWNSVMIFSSSIFQKAAFHEFSKRQHFMSFLKGSIPIAIVSPID
jgi:hypothetical protein